MNDRSKAIDQTRRMTRLASLLICLCGVGCVTAEKGSAAPELTSASTIRAQSPAQPDAGSVRLVADDPELDLLGKEPPSSLFSRGPSSERTFQGAQPFDVNPRLFQVDRGQEDLSFPDIHDDPLYGSTIAPADRDPPLFSWLSNLLAEDRWTLDRDPVDARQKRLNRQAKIDIRDPDPDTANFPNGAYTIPKGRIYLESSPLSLYGKGKGIPTQYNWEFLARYGLTDNVELRLFSNGFTAVGPPRATTGFSPLAFDMKVHFWEENTRYFIPAVGIEVYLQSTFGSPAFNSGTQPSINLLFDNTLPYEINFEYNFSITGIQELQRLTKYQFGFQWSFEKEIVEDFSVFVHGFYNAAALPRLGLLTRDLIADHLAVPNIDVVGCGAIRTLSDRMAVFGSYNLGTTVHSPSHIALVGLAIAL